MSGDEPPFDGEDENPFHGPFDGATYDPEHDEVRLKGQLWHMFQLMKDGKRRTLSEIETVTGYPQASISTRLRDFRKPRFGGHTLHLLRRGDPKRGWYEYWIHLRGCTCVECTGSPFE